MWQQDVVAFLRDCKDHGWDFAPAWELALRRYPPRGAGMGQRQLTLEDDGEPTLVQFLERACSDAWHGRCPALARLSTDLVDVPSDVRFGRAPLGSHSVGQRATMLS